MTKLIWVILVIFLVGGGALYFGFSKTQQTPSQPIQVSTTSPTNQPQIEAVDYKASFAIFTNGTFRIFTDSKYHRKSADVYIEPPDVNVIKIKKTGVTWSDFFSSLPMKLTKGCLTTGTGQNFCPGSGGSLRFYLNGQEDPNLLEKQIQNGDQALITFGDLDEKTIEEQLKKIPNP